MNKPFLLAGVAIVAMAAQSAFAEEEAVLNVYNWSDYIAEDTIAKFEEATGIKVNYDVFDSNEVLEAKMLAGGSGYDVVVPTSTFLARQIVAGVFQPLDKTKLANIDNMDAQIAEVVAEHDPGNEHSVNYLWGTTGIGYNKAMIEERMPDAPVDSWAMMFDPEIVANFADCGVSMLDAPAEMIPAALNYLGLDPASQDKGDLAKAEEHLQKIRPHIRYFHSSQYINDLANGDICMAIGWSGDVLQARDRAAEAGKGVEVVYSIPDGRRFDVVRHARHPRRCPPSRECPQISRLPDGPDDLGRHHQLRRLCERQCRGLGACFRGREERRRRLSRERGHGQALCRGGDPAQI